MMNKFVAFFQYEAEDPNWKNKRIKGEVGSRGGGGCEVKRTDMLAIYM